MKIIAIGEVDLGKICADALGGDEIRIRTQDGTELQLSVVRADERSKRIEQIAEALHDGWWEYSLILGFRLGPRNRKRLTHPHMVPWASLNAESHRQDRFQAEVLLNKWEHDAAKVTARDVHNAWMQWELKHGDKNHDHLQEFEIAHKDDPWEHTIQAERVNQLFQKWAGKR